MAASALDLSSILRANFGAPEEARAAPLDTVGLALMKLAPNAIEWCVSAQHCNEARLFTFFRSYQTIRDYFELRCPNCNVGGIEDGQPGDCWGRTRLYLESEVLLVWDADNGEDTCPKCGDTRSAFIEDGLYFGYNQLHLIAGMRSGKSITAALIGTYVEHVFYVLAHTWAGGIHGFFDITPAEKFEMTFLASNQVQSEDTIWAKFTGFRQRSPWLKSYVLWIKGQEKAQTRTGMLPWRYEENLKEIENGHPNVRLTTNALNSNSSGQAGRTRVHGFLDELARMKQTGSAMGADEIYRVLENSLQTIRSRTKLLGGFPWMGSMVSVTSPISRTDKAMRLLRLAPEIKDMYARKYATWEFNPKEPRKHFVSAYKKDPVGAERDFGANPPGAEHPLIHDETRWARICIRPRLTIKARFQIYTRKDPTGQVYVAAKLKSADRMFDRRMPRVVVFDAGKNFNSFAGACGHGEYDADGRLVTVADWFVRIVPLPNTEILFDSVVHIMRALKQYQLTDIVEFDQWQSTQLIQQIRNLGVRAEQTTLQPDDFSRWLTDSYDGLYAIPPPAPADYLAEDAEGEGPTLPARRSDPRAWLAAPARETELVPYRLPFEWRTPQPQMQPESVAIVELTELQRDPDTKKVYNPNKDDEIGWHQDDLARCQVHLHRVVQRTRIGYTERQDDRSRRAARTRVEAASKQWGARGGVVRGRR